MRHPARLLVLAVVTVLCGAGLVASPAQATGQATSVTGTVVDAEGQPIRGISILGFPEGDNDDFIQATTNNQGRFTTRRTERFSTGPRSLWLRDDADDYAGAVVQVTLAAGDNTLDPIVLQLGARATGTVSAVSGAPVRNYEVHAEPLEEAIEGYGGYATTDVEGRFELVGLTVGSYGLLHENVPEDEDSDVHFEITTPGETYASSLDVRDVRVAPAVSFRASSPSKRKATVRVAVSAARFGLSVRGGTFDLYDGSKKIRSRVSVQGGTRVLTLRGLSKGKHRLKLRFRGSTDVLPRSTSATVTVR